MPPMVDLPYMVPAGQEHSAQICKSETHTAGAKHVYSNVAHWTASIVGRLGQT